MTRVGRRLAAIAVALGLAPAGCATPRPDVPKPPGEIDLRSLEGTWHVIESTFPMWLEGAKASPAFHYRVIASFDGGLLLDDRVTYVERGEEKSIDGIDTPDPADSSHLTWRGKGLLRLFTSDWYVVMRAPSDDDPPWAVIYFSATIATPEGVDIIARAPELPAATLAKIRAAIAADPSLRRRAEGLRAVTITPRR